MKNLLKIIYEFISDNYNASINLFTILFILIFLCYKLFISLNNDLSIKNKYFLSNNINMNNVIEIVMNIKDHNKKDTIITKSCILLNPSLIKISEIKDYYKHNAKIINLDVYQQKPLL